MAETETDQMNPERKRPLAEVPSLAVSSSVNNQNKQNNNNVMMLNNERTPPRNPYSSATKKPKATPPPPAAEESSKQEKDDDVEVEVLSPPPRPGSWNCPLQQKQQQQGNDNDDECVVEFSNVTNAYIHLPHQRPYCGVHNFADDKLRYCENCYCVTCDRPVRDCTQWSLHCQESKQKTTSQELLSPSAVLRAPESMDMEDSLPSMNGAFQSYLARSTALLLNSGRLEASRLDEDSSDDDSDDDHYTSRTNRYDHHFTDEFNQRYNNDRNGKERRRNPKDMRITEVLAEKMMEALQLADNGGSASMSFASKDQNGSSKHAVISTALERRKRFENSKFDGDIAQLGLHKSFFVEGVRLGWPFPTILTPQRQMAFHLVKALKNSRHVVLESPTGTGKSAAILCATLAWQRYHARSCWGKTVKALSPLEASVAALSPLEASVAGKDKDKEADKPFPRIIYCSRTHSQVAQMVASLKKTPYRPRMTVLGSRDRLCIHREIIDRNPSKDGDKNKKKPFVNVNTACQNRVAQTEKMRRALWRAEDYRYDDDNPPESLSGDGSGNHGGHSQDEDDEALAEGDRTKSEWILKHSTKKLTCSHYRQLTSQRTAHMTRSSFMLTQAAINCCKTGGEKTSLGVHDIEDLVAFGVNPFLQKNLALYRGSSEGSFGFDVGNDCRIKKIEKDGAAASNGQLKKGDLILEINGTKVSNLKHIMSELANTTRDPLLLTVLRNAKKSPNVSNSHNTNNNNPGASSDTTYKEHDIWLTRAGGQTSWGITLEGQSGQDIGCSVRQIRTSGPADGRVLVDDIIVQVNKKNVETFSFEEVIHEIQSTQVDPLHLRVRRRHDIQYSNQAACPYFLSKELSKHADLIFAPYNYVLDPGIRSALGIDLNGAVVVLDEAHNIEGVLTESGSGKFGEIELSRLVAMLSEHSSAMRRHENLVETADGPKDLREVAHELLLFVEKIVLYMQNQRLRFERAKGNLGAAKAIEEYLKFKTPDNTEFEVSYHGPTGHGVLKKAVGCKPCFDELKITEPELNQLYQYAQAMESHLSGTEKDKTEAAGEQGKNSMFELLSGLISKFSLAQKSPEHFYISCVCQANGNLDFAAGVDEDETSGSRFKKKPLSWPFVYPRSESIPHAALPVCTHVKCKCHNGAESVPQLGYGGPGVRHGNWCDATEIPKWEAHLVLRLLFPGLIMKDITDQCRTVVLASGSLSPLQSLCAELDLHDAETQKSGRLQTKPKPLEANHVINLNKQLLAVAIGHFPDGTPLTVNYNNYKHPEFYGHLGKAIASVVELIPRGGVLIFLPSYSMLNKLVKCWNPPPFSGNRYGRSYYGDVDHSCPEIWHRFLQSKGKVIVEPSGGNQALFEEARDEYADTIRTQGSCILLAVYRGKMSEGISFNDDNARGVICVGIPYPQAKERSIVAKKAYNDEQRRLKGRTDLLPGQDWYAQEAFRAIAQALGRCIRHEADYGTVVLMDSRHCDDGSPGFVHKKLPKWMRASIRSLSMSQLGRGANPIVGGYPGLRREMDQFFSQAPAHVAKVTEQRKRDFEAAQARDNQSADHQFNSVTGSWTPSSAISDNGASIAKRITQESPMPPSNSYACGDAGDST